MDAIIYPAASWFLTYMIHSTLLLGAVWLLVKWRPIRGSATEDILWKVAVVGSLVTTTLHVSLPGNTFFPAPPVVVETVEPMSLNEAGIRSLETGRDVGPIIRVPPIVSLPPAMIEYRASARAAKPFWERAWDTVSVWPWLPILLSIWGLGVLGLGARRWFIRYQFFVHLRGRAPVHKSKILRFIERLREQARFRPNIKVTATDALASPIALHRAEICLPERAMTDLTSAQQRSLLAHEVAHLVRRDPAWLAVFSWLEVIFFFQPLNRVARRRQQAVAERCCDAWAVGATGTAETLAACLIEVASWVKAPPRYATSGMLSSPLSERIQDLIEPPAAHHRRLTKTQSIMLALVVVFSITAAAPEIHVPAPSLGPVWMQSSHSGDTLNLSFSVIDPNEGEIPDVSSAAPDTTEVPAPNVNPAFPVPVNRPNAPVPDVVAPSVTAASPSVADLPPVPQIVQHPPSPAPLAETVIPEMQPPTPPAAVAPVVPDTIDWTVHSPRLMVYTPRVAMGLSEDERVMWAISDTIALTGAHEFSWKPDANLALRLQYDGRITLNPDWYIKRLSKDGFLKLEEKYEGVHRKIEVRGSADGGVLYHYQVNGEDQPVDRAAEDWLAETLKLATDLQQELEASRLGPVQQINRTIALAQLESYEAILKEVMNKRHGIDEEKAHIKKEIEDLRRQIESASPTQVEALQKTVMEHEVRLLLMSVGHEEAKVLRESLQEQRHIIEDLYEQIQEDRARSLNNIRQNVVTEYMQTIPPQEKYLLERMQETERRLRALYDRRKQQGK